MIAAVLVRELSELKEDHEQHKVASGKQGNW